MVRPLRSAVQDALSTVGEPDGKRNSSLCAVPKVKTNRTSVVRHIKGCFRLQVAPNFSEKEESGRSTRVENMRVLRKSRVFSKSLAHACISLARLSFAEIRDHLQSRVAPLLGITTKLQQFKSDNKWFSLTSRAVMLISGDEREIFA